MAARSTPQHGWTRNRPFCLACSYHFSASYEFYSSSNVGPRGKLNSGIVTSASSDEHNMPSTLHALGSVRDGSSHVNFSLHSLHRPKISLSPPLHLCHGRRSSTPTSFAPLNPRGTLSNKSDPNGRDGQRL
jgi:hypothetical protein